MLKVGQCNFATICFVFLSILVESRWPLSRRDPSDLALLPELGTTLGAETPLAQIRAALPPIAFAPA